MGKYLQLRKYVPKAEEFIGEFEYGLDKLLMQEGLPPGVAITVIANLNKAASNPPL